MCIILGNLLDNSIEAWGNIEEDRFIVFKKYGVVFYDVMVNLYIIF